MITCGILLNPDSKPPGFRIRPRINLHIEKRKNDAGHFDLPYILPLFLYFIIFKINPRETELHGFAVSPRVHETSAFSSHFTLDSQSFMANIQVFASFFSTAGIAGVSVSISSGSGS